MDTPLRCNSLTCRTQLVACAVVTTCSHIFCVPCSETLGLANPANGTTRTCPACAMHLTNPDDAVVTQLNPTEDYKTSVMSGLHPTIIMECAGRGLNFHAYQMTQEVNYQHFLVRRLEEKCSDSNSQMDKFVIDANSRIRNLCEELSATKTKLQILEQKNQDLSKALRDKAKSQQQLQKLYASLKQQQLARGIELAAEHEAESVIQGASGGPTDHHGHHLNARRALSRSGSNHGGGRASSGGQHYDSLHAWENQMQSGRGTLQNPRGAPVLASPSGHRTRLLQSQFYENRGPSSVHRSEAFAHRTPVRPPLENVDPNVYGNRTTPVYGMSAGVKVGRQQSGPTGRNGTAATVRPGAFNELNGH